MILGTYKNGNYTVTIYDDGTRVRDTDGGGFVPSFAECMDVQISNFCGNGCKWCYAGCSPSGKHADLKSYKWLFDTMHPYTELAINLNSEWPKDLYWFLQYMKDRGVLVNATISQPDFERHFCELRKLTDINLIRGLGVSFLCRDSGFISMARQIPNLVVHVIEGIADRTDFRFLSGKELKVLILGYKESGRGAEFRKEQNAEIIRNRQWLKENLADIIPGFKAAAFDNLALDRLSVKDLFSEEDWLLLHSGREGEFTFYLDLAAGTYAVNSMQEPLGRIEDKSIDQMFLDVRQKAGFLEEA